MLIYVSLNNTTPVKLKSPAKVPPKSPAEWTSDPFMLFFVGNTEH